MCETNAEGALDGRRADAPEADHEDSLALKIDDGTVGDGGRRRRVVADGAGANAASPLGATALGRAERARRRRDASAAREARGRAPVSARYRSSRRRTPGVRRHLRRLGEARRADQL